MRAALLLGLGAIAACYDPTYRDLACGANGACPDGYQCRSDVCVPDVEVDARPDAPDDDATDAPIDTPVIDARIDGAVDATDAPIDAVPPCPVGDVTSPTDPTRCFRFRPQTSTWDAARVSCISLGGRLADVRNTQENQALVPLIGNAPAVWLGGTDGQTEGLWLWTDGVQFTFNAWAEGQPTGQPGEDCVRFVGSGQLGFGPSDWTDQQCNVTYASVCVLAP